MARDSTALGAIPAEALDGQHHPCPKCGGKDRFRMIDGEAGTMYAMVVSAKTTATDSPRSNGPPASRFPPLSNWWATTSESRTATGTATTGTANEHRQGRQHHRDPKLAVTAAPESRPGRNPPRPRLAGGPRRRRGNPGVGRAGRSRQASRRPATFQTSTKRHKRRRPSTRGSRRASMWS